jgi:urea-proton symporter
MVVSPETGYLLLFAYAVVMIALTWAVSRSHLWTGTREGFLYAARSVSSIPAAFSIAASWIWAPALFVSVQKSYELGLPGLFWFTAPNVIAVIIYAWLGPSIRRRIPGGFSIPDWIRWRFESENASLGSLAHKLYLVPFVWYQVMAVTVQIFVGGLIFQFLTGINLDLGMLLLLLIVLTYSLISGLRASITTDFLHLVFILLALAIIVPWTVAAAGVDKVYSGLGGIAGNRNIFDPEVAFSFGIVTSIGLIAGSIADQQFWQRVFAIRQDQLVRSFVWGGILFGIVPIVISILGFIAAAPDSGVAVPPGTGLPMIGVATVVKYLPTFAGVLFVLMLLNGLSSALDSGFAATASLYAIDMRRLTRQQVSLQDKERLNLPLTDEEKRLVKVEDGRSVFASRISMVILAIVGYLVALGAKELFPLDRLWWLFNGVASMFVVPTLLSIYWDNLSVRGVIVGLVASLVGMIVFVYGNYIQNDTIVVYSAIAIVLINLVACFAFRRNQPWIPQRI